MLRPALLAAALTAAFPAHADPQLDALRAELQELKSAYEARIQAGTLDADWRDPAAGIGLALLDRAGDIHAQHAVSGFRQAGQPTRKPISASTSAACRVEISSR